jgi:carboxymethylenebutenolidase
MCKLLYIKFLTVSFILIFSFSLAYGQTCCSSVSANETFANLGGSSKFSLAHQLPRLDTLAEPLGKLIGIPTPTDESNPRGYGYFITASEPTDKVILVFHEWWGLNDNIKREADAYYTSLEGKAHVLAVDLYDYKKATTREKAAELMQNASEERIKHILQGAFSIAGPDAKFATVGWCFGGTWSLQAAIEGKERVLACVKYYGMPESKEERLNELSAPVLAIFAKQDQWITPQVAENFKKMMVSLDKELLVLNYDADHAFANPSNPQYDEEMTESAFNQSVQFLKNKLFE